MKKISLFLLAALLICIESIPCTTFFINQHGQMLFGRNYDWVTGTGLIHTNLRDLSKRNFIFPDSSTLHWVSKYGSITFNQYGKEFPTGGMNEKGLVVELMWLDETIYPQADKRPSLSVLQWIQYQLDNCATVEEVIATDKQIRIGSNTPLHYLVADANGQAATIEFLDGKLVVHKGKDLPYAVLTNSTYKSSVESLGTKQHGDNSLERFGKACEKMKKLTKTTNSADLVDYSFEMLEEVSQGSYTKWSIVYDIRNRKINFRTNDNSKTRTLSFADLKFECTSSALYVDMNGSFTGDLFPKMNVFDSKVNTKTTFKAFEESRSQVKVPDDIITALTVFPTRIGCRKGHGITAKKD